ncbi:MAG TPA: disulfide reductase, partial [Clostridiales bacterium UBA8153]|nr:disulfide reductase [Clostridiales bacterium UBA8153]
ESAQQLGLDLVELESWQCCGAVFSLATDAVINWVAPYRALAAADRDGADLVTMCSGCLNVLRRTNRLVASNGELREKLGAFVDMEYAGQRKVHHLLELLKQQVTFAALADRVTTRLSGLRVAPYYGCLLLRPAEEMAFDDPEAPTILEDCLRALGAEPVDFPLKTECCGAFVSLHRGNLDASAAVARSASLAKADLVVTSCPTCSYNLEQAGPSLPVVYFTQLLALSLGLDGAFSGHAIDPRPVLRKKSLLREVN